MTQEVIYGKHGDGPLQGGFNGDRKYNVEFSDTAKSMWTFHFLDGARVRIFYREIKRLAEGAMLSLDPAQVKDTPRTVRSREGRRLTWQST